jgi:adenylate cyclase
VTSANADRKLAAILCADIAGYARLMEDDGEATVRTLRVWREQIGALVGEHRGRIADFSGDNFLAEFPTARDAVACAIEIQRVLRARNAGLPAERRMEFRIGAHLGDVQSEGERLFGDGVNIAARLQTLAEPGGICLSAAVHEQVRSKLGLVCEDLGEHALKNIASPVRAYRLRVPDAPPQAAQPSAPHPSRTRTIAFVAALAIALAGIGIWAAWPRLLGVAFDAAGILPGEQPALPDKPSIAVLPFANMSGDPEQEYFADGITEDLTTVLSQTSTLFVIARNSAFAYKGRAVKVEDVGRELGVRYVLEGSVRRAGERVRITAQLIETASGFHVWSESYDRGLEDVFAVQSEIAERVFVATGAPIMEAELDRIRRKPTASLTAYDAYAKGMYHFGRIRVRDMAEARRWFERAVELDPGSGTRTSRGASPCSIVVVWIRRSTRASARENSLRTSGGLTCSSPFCTPEQASRSRRWSRSSEPCA